MSVSRFASGAARIGAIAFALVASFPDGYDSVRTSLDPSWTWAINCLGLHGFGSKVAFTYGPLGFLVYPLPIGRHVLAAAAVRLAVQLAFAAAAGLAAMRASAVQTVLFAALYSLAAGAGLHLDAQVLVLGAACAGLCLRYESATGLLCLGLISSCMIFAKTSLELAAIAILAATAALWLLQRRPLWTPLAMLGLHGAGMGAAALFFFSPPAEFFGWLKATLEIAREYSVNMSVVGGHLGWGIALTAAWMLGAAALYFHKSAAAPVAVLSGGLVFLFFKQGFVREDLHVLGFYSTLLACAALLLLFAEGTRDCLRVSALCLALLCGVTTAGQRSKALQPGWMKDSFSLRHGLDQLSRSVHWEDTDRRLRLASNTQEDVLPPRLVAKLRGATVGVIPWELDFCVANGLRCSWNPTLQTYAAYTPDLDRRTAAHFAGPDAPDFMLIDRVLEFDGRAVTLDTPFAWQALVAGYELTEVPLQGPLVLQRKPGGVREPPRLLGEARGHTGQWLEIPSSPDLVLGSLELKLNLRGRLAKVLLRVPSVWLDVEYGGGRSRRIRISPATAGDGLLLGEVPGSLAELLALFEGVRLDPVRRVRFSGAAMKYLQEEFAVRWFTMPRPPSKPFQKVALLPRPDQPRIGIDFINDASFAPERVFDMTSRGVFEMAGWARGPNDEQACGVMLGIDGVRDLPLLHGLERRWQPGRTTGGAHDGFEGTVAASALGPGRHRLKLRVIGSDCTSYSESTETILVNVR